MKAIYENQLFFKTKFCVAGTFPSFLVRNSDIHANDTRIDDYFHITLVKTDLGKTGITYTVAIICDIIIKDDINTDVFELYLKDLEPIRPNGLFAPFDLYHIKYDMHDILH